MKARLALVAGHWLGWLAWNGQIPLQGEPLFFCWRGALLGLLVSGHSGWRKAAVLGLVTLPVLPYLGSTSLQFLELLLLSAWESCEHGRFSLVKIGQLAGGSLFVLLGSASLMPVWSGEPPSNPLPAWLAQMALFLGVTMLWGAYARTREEPLPAGL